MSQTAASASETLDHDVMASRKRRYTIAIVAAGTALILLMQNPFFPLAMRLMFLAMLLLGLIRWSAAILLILIQLDLYVSVPRYGAVDESPSLIIAFVTVVLLAVLSRLRSAQEASGIRSARTLLSSAAGYFLTSDVASAEDRSTEDHDAAREGLWIAGSSLLLVVLATTLLQMYPPDRASVRDYGLTPTGMQAIQIGLILFMGYVLVSLPFNEFWWRRLTPHQAGTYLRSRLTGWVHRDLRAVERRRRRIRNKQTRALRRHRKDTYLQYSEKAE